VGAEAGVERAISSASSFPGIPTRMAWHPDKIGFAIGEMKKVYTVIGFK